jgi:hypothetical protein
VSFEQFDLFSLKFIASPDVYCRRAIYPIVVNLILFSVHDISRQIIPKYRSIRSLSALITAAGLRVFGLEKGIVLGQELSVSLGR